ncbi:MAG: hypothetical protein HON07_02505 [Planctomycetaceae bacterium]|nr:hypothetical protein [Planctomycetaceae bacterium]
MPSKHEESRLCDQRDSLTLLYCSVTYGKVHHRVIRLARAPFCKVDRGRSCQVGCCVAVETGGDGGVSVRICHQFRRHQFRYVDCLMPSLDEATIQTNMEDSKGIPRPRSLGAATAVCSVTHLGATRRLRDLEQTQN